MIHTITAYSRANEQPWPHPDHRHLFGYYETRTQARHAVLTDYDTAFEEGRCAVERDRPLYAPRNPYPEDTQAHLGWHEGADEGGIMRDYTNGVRSDGQARKP